MDIKQAIEICEEYGWDINRGKYFLESEGDRVIFQNDEELINYAESLEKNQ